MVADCLRAYRLSADHSTASVDALVAMLAEVARPPLSPDSIWRPIYLRNVVRAAVWRHVHYIRRDRDLYPEIFRDRRPVPQMTTAVAVDWRTEGF